ncbi:YfiR family protein [Aureliella helgolandensis]|uniref:DUF4154 domain-containing protein n=1 Tax=Aureliella helgolandensis TaxID=2527968 RepID=A0A518G985_9BACT|nr:YfiR family protein [Aureliella helgolandensis]QDV25129.1 hypothetical protein Q31a_34520 [Aureliella helgolandensis]
MNHRRTHQFHGTDLRRVQCRSRIFWILSVFLPLLAQVRDLHAQDVVVRETPLKAAYIYNFAKYVQWPAASTKLVGTENPIVCGVYGPSALEVYLQKIAAKKTVNGRPIAVHRYDSVANLGQANILFVPASVSDVDYQRIVQALANTSTMLFGERMDLADNNSVTFYIESNRVKFQINLENTEAAGLQISSKVLQLGRLVRGHELVRAGE